jgi:serine/threonine-protein kinase
VRVSQDIREIRREPAQRESPVTLRGTLIAGQYRLEEVIGRGGMGIVHSAVGTHDGQRYAVKLLRGADGADAMARRRFAREASNALRINHPNAVRTFAVGEQDDFAWMVMELIEGRSLNQVLEREGRCEPDMVVAWIRELADVLDFVHALGIIHRDVKPGNVMVTGAGIGARIRLLDFGLSRDLDNAAHVITRDGRAAGTPGFMAPEQRLGLPPDCRADVFSLAAVAAWALPLATPMFGKRRRWPAAVDAVLSAALTRDPVARTPTAGAFAASLAVAAREPGWVHRQPLIRWRGEPSAATAVEVSTLNSNEM